MTIVSMFILTVIIAVSISLVVVIVARRLTKLYVNWKSGKKENPR